MSINRVILVGRLTRDPELKYTPSGKAVASFGIAVQRNMSRQSAQQAEAQGQPTADFFNVTAWDRQAEFAANYLNKGGLVALDGRLQHRTWVDQQSGQKRSVVDVVAQALQGLDRPREAAAPGEAPAPGAAAATETAEVGPDDYLDPFADQ